MLFVNFCKVKVSESLLLLKSLFCVLVIRQIRDADIVTAAYKLKQREVLLNISSSVKLRKVCFVICTNPLCNT